MTNYYEFLNMAANASSEELQAAIDGLYNEWRQSVTHPDPVVVEEANRKLRLLEKARSTLMDPAKRADYDTSLDISRAGGLADPTAAPRQAPPPPPRPKMPPAGKAETAALWACRKCGTENPEWTQFCLNCRAELVRRCPECGQLKSLVKTNTCGSCGFEYRAAERRMELKKLVAGLQAHQAELQKSINLLGSRLPAPNQTRPGLSILIFPIVIFLSGVVMLLVGFRSLVLLIGGLHGGDSTVATFYLVCGPVALLLAGLWTIYLQKNHRALLNRASEKRQRITTLQEEIGNLQAQIDQLMIEHDRIGQARTLK